MSLRISNLTIHEGLAIIRVDGYEPDAEIVVVDGVSYDATPPGIDLPGSANWLVEQYGLSGDDYAGPGILYTDYDGPDWEFDILIDEDEVEAFKEFAVKANYDILKVTPIEEPTHFGDEGGIVEILKHRDGWVVLGR